MNNIGNPYIATTATTFNKVVLGITCIAAISAIAMGLIGLVAPTIVQMDPIDHGIFLGTSIVVLILDLLWMKTLYKKKNFLQSASSLIQSRSIPEPALTFVSQIHKIVQSKLEPTTLPNVLNVLFLSYLDPDTLDKCSRVKGWEEFANTPSLWNSFDLRTLSPKLKVFGEREWETHVDLPSFGLEISDAQPLNKRTLMPELYRLISSLPVCQDSGFTFLTIPKGLTLNKLIRLAGMPKQGFITNVGHIWAPILQYFGNISIDHTYRIAISNDVIYFDTGKSTRRIKEGRTKLLKEFGGQMPGVLEAMTLKITTYMYSMVHVLGMGDVYVSCLEQINKCHVVFDDHLSVHNNLNQNYDLGIVYTRRMS